MKHKTALRERTQLHEYENGDCEADMVYLYRGFWGDVNWTVNYCPRCDQIVCCVGGGVHHWNYTSATPLPENLENGRRKAAELNAILNAVNETPHPKRKYTGGYWQSGEDIWYGDEVEDGCIPIDAVYHSGH